MGFPEFEPAATAATMPVTTTDELAQSGGAVFRDRLILLRRDPAG